MRTCEKRKINQNGEIGGGGTSVKNFLIWSQHDWARIITLYLYILAQKDF